ncbi:restriction endonuclease subunit S [Janibacter sp. Y6]|uniref:restriction endonuclease subunit S n=1 Tax=Janibacter sp. Y6 TaxID=2913552 RepID=UPI0034A194EC
MKTAAFGDVLRLSYGKALKQADRSGGGPIPVVGSGGIVGWHETGLTPGPTVVVGRKGSIGSVTWVDGPAWPIDTAYFVESIGEGVHLRWTYWLLQSLGLNGMNKSAAVPGLNREDVYRLTIPLPPLEEQRRIAAILDHADALRAKRRQILAHLDSLPFAILRSALGQLAGRSVTPRPAAGQPAGFTWVKLTDVARLATGHTPDRKRPEYWSGDISWLSLPEIRALDGQVVERTAFQVAQAGIDASSAVVLPAGTVCFSRTASLGFVTLMGAPMATSQDFHNWVPGPRLHPEYLMAALRSSRNHLIAGSDGSTHRTIYQRAAQKFHILLPSRETQNEIAVFSKCLREQRTQAQQSVAAHDELFASLQARAFRGEL